MKNKVLSLLKINILNSFKLKTFSIKKKLLVGVFALYIIATIMLSIGIFMNELFKMLSDVNLITYFIPILFALTSLFAFVFSIYSAKAGLFENKDNELLFSLPISKWEILLSRLLYLTIFNFCISLVFIIPGLFISLNSISSSLEFYVSIFFMLVFLPVIPTVLASLFGYLIAFLVSKVQKKSFFELLYYFLFIGLYIYIMMNGTKILNLLINNVELMNKLLKFCFLPIFLVSKGINTNNLIYALYFVLINIIVLLLFVFVLNKNYFKLIIKLGTFHANSNYHMKKLITHDKKKALIKKELKRYFSSPIYVFNTIFGVLAIFLASIASLFYDSDKILSIIDMDVNLTVPLLVFSLLLFSISMTNTACSSISIEGKNFWILKMLPIDTKDIFKAKLFVNKIIIIPTLVVGLLLFFISGYLTYQQMLLLLVFSCFYSLFVSNFGLIANLLLPKFDAINDMVVVKQSASTMVGLLIPVFLSLIIIGLLGTVSLNVNTILFIAIGISFLLFVISFIVLNTWGLKKFHKLG